MLYIILLITVFILGTYFAFRYFSMLYALDCIVKELNDIQKDITQNQIVHLPIPNRHLAKLLSSFNRTLEEIREERQKYEKREKEFQSQIENISHDLRTPLTVILGYLKLLKKSENNQITENKELSEMVDIIRHKAEIMKNLVTQFYDFSRLNAGDYELPLGNVDVSRTLRESLMGNFQILEQAHLNIVTDIPDYPVWVLGEESALERIFLNLFQNAGRYADTYLHISVKRHHQQVSVLFINDTQELSKDDIPQLFQRFYRQDVSRNQSGTGLGLTVAKSLADEMGAELKVYAIGEEIGDDKPGTMKICFELSLSFGDTGL